MVVWRYILNQFIVQSVLFLFSCVKSTVFRGIGDFIVVLAEYSKFGALKKYLNELWKVWTQQNGIIRNVITP